MQRLMYSAILFIAACAADGTGSTNEQGAQEVVQAPTTAVCALATQTCLTACADTDDACPDNCMMADPAAEACSQCIDDAYTSCVNSAGCQAQYDALEC